MSFIREERLKPDYDPNTSHCIYGNDADLILLALASHEPRIAIYREEVNKFNKNKKDHTLLYISKLRDYFELEFH